MEKFINLIVDVKSIVTLAMTGAMIALLFTAGTVNAEAQSLFCTAYGAIITYFFTKQPKSAGDEEEETEAETETAVETETETEEGGEAE
jgi:hypothetical protein